MAVDKYGEQPMQRVVAEGTDFKYGEWHAIGISYGSEGQHIMLDGINTLHWGRTKINFN
jgi:hypothetical protein